MDDRGAGWLQSLRSRFGFEAAPTLRDALEEALRAESLATGAFSVQEREMISRILRFGALRVEDCMVPRADIIAIDEKETLGRLLERFTEAGVSRIPVYRETLDDPRGMIHIKDLVRWLTTKATGQSEQKPLSAETAMARPVLNLAAIDLSQPIASANVNRQVLYVPPSMPALSLFLRMQSTRIHLAMVIDEYGGTDGLVSIEDLVEEIVGEIEDEHDKDVASISRDAKLGLVALGRAPIAEVEAEIGLTLADTEMAEEIDTLGGLIFKLAGRVPIRGEIIPHPAGLEFEVLDADARRLKKIRIHVRPAGSARASNVPEPPKA
ncbi:MAG: HlyC/CorC family transporter [Hyphomicrobiaceae bacterium]|nr:MAG: HlyC/CorC family transporter [Hyphomicrobiaceae bacterium]